MHAILGRPVGTPVNVGVLKIVDVPPSQNKPLRANPVLVGKVESKRLEKQRSRVSTARTTQNDRKPRPARRNAAMENPPAQLHGIDRPIGSTGTPRCIGCVIDLQVMHCTTTKVVGEGTHSSVLAHKHITVLRADLEHRNLSLGHRLPDCSPSVWSFGRQIKGTGGQRANIKSGMPSSF